MGIVFGGGGENWDDPSQAYEWRRRAEAAEKELAIVRMYGDQYDPEDGEEEPPDVPRGEPCPSGHKGPHTVYLRRGGVFVMLCYECSAVWGRVFVARALPLAPNPNR